VAGGCVVKGRVLVGQNFGFSFPILCTLGVTADYRVTVASLDKLYLDSMLGLLREISRMS
jgi:hypothetical protein